MALTRVDLNGSKRVRLRLGELLLKDGLVTRPQLDAALAEQRRTGERLGRLLVAAGVLTEGQLLGVLAASLGVEAVDLEEQVPDFTAGRLLRESFARRHQALPIGWDGKRLVVAMANPADVFALDDVRSMTGASLKVVMADPDHLARAIDRTWRANAEDSLRLADTSEEEELDPATAETVDGPVVQFVNDVLARAVAERASDVHLEPGERDLRIRFRVDGVLHDVMAVPQSIRSTVVSRLKIMGDMNIAERRLPQDGRMTMVLPSGTADVRLVTLPTTQGESLVMRILDRSKGMRQIDDLGFLPDTRERFRSCYRRPWGAVLVTGPTGSGKSTSLYAALGELNSPNRNIVTVEDPVEYQVAGIKQIQLNRKAGLTFANALRSVMRADPDVVLVGEIRDRETAGIAVEAALTGHLVLSTLHTNDAASTPARLVDMGVEPFLVTSSLSGVLAQRLVRRLCEKCTEPYHPKADELIAAGWDDALAAAVGQPRFHRAVGCARCSKSGYYGRFAVHEVMPFTEDIAHLVLTRSPTEEVAEWAVESGMTTMRRDGLIKVGQGLTTFEELLRVVQ
ncbi:MAG TPA: ATPase, T2SS/T4P/T4SS family [Acidimicrobiales bacterium]|nr:ATPase, T2SS/T4P/T4SS family [Acidimicrobiales bacterium]